MVVPLLEDFLIICPPFVVRVDWRYSTRYYFRAPLDLNAVTRRTTPIINYCLESLQIVAVPAFLWVLDDSEAPKLHSRPILVSLLRRDTPETN